MKRSTYVCNRKPLAIALSVAFATVLSGLAEHASANTIITVASDVPAFTYVGSAIGGTFDINAGNTASSGSVTATFSDSGGYQYNGTSYGSYYYSGSNTYYAHTHGYCCGFSTCYDHHYYTDNNFGRNNTNYYFNPYESAGLNVGVGTVYAGSNYYDNGSSYQGSYGSGSNWNGNGYDYFTDNVYAYYQGYGGNFSTTINLDAAALADLNADGLLGFNIFSTNGNFYVTDVSLTATLVPEPGSLALLGIALGGLGFARWSRKQRVALA